MCLVTAGVEVEIKGDASPICPAEDSDESINMTDDKEIESKENIESLMCMFESILNIEGRKKKSTEGNGTCKGSFCPDTGVNKNLPQETGKDGQYNSHGLNEQNSKAPCKLVDSTGDKCVSGVKCTGAKDCSCCSCYKKRKQALLFKTLSNINTVRALQHTLAHESVCEFITAVCIAQISNPKSLSAVFLYYLPTIAKVGNELLLKVPELKSFIPLLCKYFSDTRDGRKKGIIDVDNSKNSGMKNNLESSVKKKSELYRHHIHKVVCDGCSINQELEKQSKKNGTIDPKNGYIRGICYKSIRSKGFSLCETCESSYEFDSSHGPLVKFTSPEQHGFVQMPKICNVRRQFMRFKSREKNKKAKCSELNMDKFMLSNSYVPSSDNFLPNKTNVSSSNNFLSSKSTDMNMESKGLGLNFSTVPTAFGKACNESHRNHSIQKGNNSNGIEPFKNKMNNSLDESMAPGTPLVANNRERNQYMNIVHSDYDSTNIFSYNSNTGNDFSFNNGNNRKRVNKFITSREMKMLIYKKQLSFLHDAGFKNDELNIAALRMVQGNAEDALTQLQQGIDNSGCY